jgi:hypothetical protein
MRLRSLTTKVLDQETLDSIIAQLIAALEADKTALIPSKTASIFFATSAARRSRPLTIANACAKKSSRPLETFSGLPSFPHAKQRSEKWQTKQRATSILAS